MNFNSNNSYSSPSGDRLKIARDFMTGDTLYCFQAGVDYVKMRIVRKFGPLSLFETTVYTSVDNHNRVVRTLGLTRSLHIFDIRPKKA